MFGTYFYNVACNNCFLACYTLWNVWKERGRRIFEGKDMNVAVLVQHIREEVKQVQTALLL
jgi:hypothetical protein